MRGKWHFVLTTGFFITLWLIFNIWLKKEYFTITQIIAAIPISFFPDVDHNFKVMGHRNWFSHSIILFEIVYLFNHDSIFLILILGIGFHCLCDIRLQPKKQVGYYTIKWFGIKKNGKYKYPNLNGKYSTVWLNLNFWIAFIQFIIIVVIF
ncbi:hypothetical protein LCGC14_0797960 [marine sediment metagenome]|uniref:Uncharacterized protein n=1 Tax=marine sediment metagenome TaxID=412755 RepID=A0A0F9PQH7_9ZZZZ